MVAANGPGVARIVGEPRPDAHEAVVMSSGGSERAVGGNQRRVGVVVAEVRDEVFLAGFCGFRPDQRSL